MIRRAVVATSNVWQAPTRQDNSEPNRALSRSAVLVPDPDLGRCCCLPATRVEAV